MHCTPQLLWHAPMLSYPARQPRLQHCAFVAIQEEEEERQAAEEAEAKAQREAERKERRAAQRAQVSCCSHVL